MFYVLQNKENGLFIYTENPLAITNSFDRALLFKETVIKDKLKQYKKYKKVKYIPLGNIVSRY